MDKITAVLKLLPVLISAIKAIEEAIPGRGKGELKLAAIREILEQADETAKGLWPLVAGTISTLVGLFNKTGIFKKEA